jgi:hypothetical protein
MPWTAHARAAVIALYLVVVTLAAVPTPQGFSRARLDDPAVRESLEAWSALFRGAGLVEDDDAFADLAWEAGQGLVDARKAVIGPFERFFWLTGTRQSWRMYGGVDRRSARLEIAVRERGVWRVVFRDLAVEEWGARLLNQERVRSLRDHFADKQNRGKWRAWVTWMAERAAEDHPRAERFRMRFVAVEAAAPDVVLEAGGLPETGSFWAEERDLVDLR